MASVTLHNVSRRFQDSRLGPEASGGIEPLSLEIPDGEFWVLVGPSGCGKSTILRLIAGLETPTTGEIYIGSRLVNQVPAQARDVAMVFQNYALYPHLTVAENIGFGLKMRKTDPSKIQAQVQRIAQMLGISPLLARKPKQLSGGQQQRVALGRAIARSPQVFLLDEPLSNLDAQLRDDTRAELKQLHQTIGVTTLYVTHDQIEAMTLADRIVVLNRGQVQQIGTPAEIYQAPANRMVASFMGQPAMNLWPGVYQSGQVQFGEQGIPCPEALKPRLREGIGLELGIRPEHLQVHPSNAEMTLKAQVILIEPMGREVWLHCQLPGLVAHPLLVIAPTDYQPTLGEWLKLGFSSGHLYLFEQATGQTLL
ncbi:ABC transporter ATP-binding protein [Synechococcus sp. PCC 6312]|uniref:ABC transporter ATP-binding protein n=1 Tax=Synechococcus sp. (strain ATCC 27167 / PCC 6312) TaxID=195253 RepID=UPI00029F1327|nr:ATP-binding cassette domain-containing protein [Synechococcus sp. PCC 6312]AFY61386.1 carbohydrate ABC transporter ATP-binding protein, CUT1 family [Synechococcus sp. PCC 6312]